MCLENTWPVKSTEEKEGGKKKAFLWKLAHEEAADIAQAAVHKAASDRPFLSRFLPLPLLAMPPPRR